MSVHDVRPDAPNPEEEQRRARGGFPWCDTCKRPAVWSELWGWLHSTAEHPFGVPAQLDPHGDHEVTAREWYAR
jgi:hypothetical protein